jgi:phospholipase C
MVRRISCLLLAAAALTGTLVLTGCASSPVTSGGGSSPVTSAAVIQHVVVIYDENESFNHYFGTYPNAQNNAGETSFTAAAGTPTPNNYISNPSLLTGNPNASNTANSTGATNPFRLPPADAYLYTQTHFYPQEQEAFDNGNMDLFPKYVGASNSKLNSGVIVTSPATVDTTGLTMGYFDGNTVTALWNYAQHYAINDHFFGATFGPSTVGAINLISGQTNGVVNDSGASTYMTPDGNNGFTLINDPDPTNDYCSGSTTVHMTGKNIGDLLNAGSVTWGWFEGGFNLNLTNSNFTTGCGRSTYSSISGITVSDYVPHHEPFQYYATTANPNHQVPSSIASIGTATDAANHQYDTNDFINALAAKNLPSVSFLKAPAYQDSHAGNSDPLDEQAWIVSMVNLIELSPYWKSTVIIVSYDDSDGWYDHMNNVVNGSNSLVSPATTSTVDSAICVNASGSASPSNALPGVNAATLHAQGRCGHGPRLPIVVISPWAKKNFIDSTPTDQTSIIRFIEDTFLNGQRIGGGSYDAIAGSLNNMFDFSTGSPNNPNVVLLNPTTGVVTSSN